jgi:serine/threonine protein kinase
VLPKVQIKGWFMQRNPHPGPKSLAILGYTDFTLIDETESSSLYRARAPDERPVLIKIPASKQPSESFVRQLEHELVITRELNQEFVVKPYKIVRKGGQVSLIQEGCSYTLLKDLIERPLDVEPFLHIAVGIAAALAEVHGAGLVHNDIRPENIFATIDGKVKLTGFSIASRLSRDQQEPGSYEVIARTLAYMAPEQTGRMNRPIDYRSDLYSLGAVFYTMLSGKPPFQRSDPMELIHCHIAQQPESLIKIFPTVPEVLSKIVDKLLSKAAEERYQSAFGLKSDLEAALSQFIDRGCIQSFEIGKSDELMRFLIPEKLYGRKNEITKLIQGFSSVSCGEKDKKMITVSGYPGIGKSVLVNEIHKPVRQESGYFISGKFDQLNRDVPYSAIIESIQNLINQILTESKTELNAWKTALTTALGSYGQVVVEIIPELEFIIGKQPDVPTLPPTESQNRFNLLVTNSSMCLHKRTTRWLFFWMTCSGGIWPLYIC